jgi:MoaA/NifB/PqqE/SkfB family radical SAM enzyme
MFQTINFDIVGGCNAKCPYCVTARTTFGQKIKHISVPDFARTVDRLVELGFADRRKSVVNLFSWGEPILHPDLDGIISALADRGLRVGISTNASRRTKLTTSTKHFVELIFSVPGWSQESYDKIHGFRFDKIVANMEATIRNVRSNGHTGPIRLFYHVYQFNCFEELEQAKRWCARNGVILNAFNAYLNDYEQNKAFLKQTMSREQLSEISRNLFLHYVDDVVSSKPEGWQCPQWDSILTLNHKSEVLLCCVLPETHEAYALGSIFDLSREQILSLKTSNKECDDCLGCGTAYWAHNWKKVDPPEKQKKSLGYWWKAAGRALQIN